MHKILKFILPLLAAAMMTFSSSVAQVSNFADVSPANVNADAILYLRINGVIEGIGDNKYAPERTINRAEFVKIATLMMPGADEGVKTCIKEEDRARGYLNLSDVASGEWYAPYVCYAIKTGAIKGYADGTFKPAREISFAEASKIVLNVFGYTDLSESTPEWFSNYLDQMAILKNIPTDIKGPHSLLTRGQMAEIVWRIKANIDYKPSQTSTELQKPKLLAGQTLPTIESCIELEEKISSRIGQNKYYLTDGAVPMATPAAAFQEKAFSESATVGAGGTASNDFSQTNVQVAGVDESDIIKNDGSYIYAVRRDTVRIIKANPVENMMELSKIRFADENFYPQEIYLRGDTLVIIGSGWYQDPSIMVEARSLRPYEYGQNRTKAYIVDISDRSDPKPLRNVSIQGNLTSSRRIGDFVYLVMNKYPNYVYPMPMATDLIPRISDSAVGVAGITGQDEPLVDCTGIHYFPGFNRPDYLIVATLPLADQKQPVEREVILGSSENVYASLRNLYVAATDYQYYSDVIDSANPTLDETGEKTVIYKFDLDQGKVRFKTSGKVPGNILNQFSMDEYGANFRIATTKYGNFNDKWLETNNLFVLDKDLNIVGSIRNIAPGEKIYSTRFLGDRGYMVTFKNTDPLFVFDLKDPRNPKILGKLKIPGFSDYLHPYDENHIIGFGKDTVEPSKEELANGWNSFAWYQGMKIALFDISNVEEPKQRFVEIIGDRGTESELLRNHKALLFDKSRNLLAFPVRVAEIAPDQKVGTSGSVYGETVFQGAYVYNLDLQTGFTLKGKISHYDDSEIFKKSGDYFYGDPGLNISRIVRIGEILYSYSENMIKAVGLEKIEEKNRVTITD